MNLPLTDLTHREKLAPWLNANGLTGAMAEIGCAFGGYARHVLAEWKGQLYVMVDPWVKQPAEVYKEKTDGIDYDAWFRNCSDLAKEDARVKLYRMLSVEGAKQFADDTFDVVYIDDNHCKEAVRASCDAWWPKARSGGLFCGHDFYDAKCDGHYCEVKTAVTEWVAEKGLTIHFTDACSSWWIIKP